MDYEIWMKQAVNTIDSEIQMGNLFEVKQLFPGHQWDSLSRGERSSFGKYFSEAVKEGRLPMIERCGEGRSHHNLYKKKEVL